MSDLSLNGIRVIDTFAAVHHDGEAGGEVAIDADRVAVKRAQHGERQQRAERLGVDRS